jgi:hypothetical protein
MLIRGVAAAAALLAVGQAAYGNEKPPPLRRVSCAFVGVYVAKYSEAAAEAWARGHGATDAEIEIARKCLSAGPTLDAASFVPKQ